MLTLTQLVLAGTAAAAIIPRDDGGDRYGKDGAGYKHVAIFSFDGLHASDVDKYLALKGPSTNLSKILEHSHRFTGAYTSFPSDSFPGSMGPFTGASPKTHGVWYDDIYDRSLYAPGSNCVGAPGAEIVYDETVDFNLDLLFSGGMNPANLPMIKTNGKCSPLYPHNRIRVNTIFEAVVAAGKKTAYADKHPTYDIVRGPSGTGLTTGYFPEINNAGSPTDNVDKCIVYDTLHLNAFLGWIDGKDPANAEGSLKGEVPTLFGGNFQSVSVGQKTKGYVAGTNAFSPDLLKAMDFMDASLGAIVNKLKEKNIYEDTLLIVNSKHGQSPIDVTTFKEVDPAVFATELAVKTFHTTFDDIAMIFLQDQKDLDTAVKNLNAHKTDLRISDIIYGQRQIDLGFGDPKKDPAVPDIIVQPIPGTIYTTSKAKVAEHGGNAADDRNVACFISSPNLNKKVYTGRVETKQVAPIVLKALGIAPSKLQGVVAEGTQPLEGW